MDGRPEQPHAASDLDPGLQQGSPLSPSPSYRPEDFPALQGPAHSQASMESPLWGGPNYSDGQPPSPPKAQRPSRSWDPSTSGDHAGTPPSYAQMASAQAPSQGEAQARHADPWEPLQQHTP